MAEQMDDIDISIQTPTRSPTPTHSMKRKRAKKGVRQKKTDGTSVAAEMALQFYKARLLKSILKGDTVKIDHISVDIYIKLINETTIYIIIDLIKYHLISILRTPYISLYNGITMGGGVGISVHGRYRIATNVSTFAMPETAIGFHPDVGGSFFLPRLSGYLGMFLALSGYRLKGRDICHSGIATHYLHLDEMSRLEYQLSQIRDFNEVRPLLDVLKIQPKPERCIINPRMQLINYAFGADTVEEIFERLYIQNDEWGNSIRDLLILMSPISLKVTHKSLSIGAKLTLKDCLRMECNISNHFLQTNDFYEGVRAILLEKDKMPKWKPSALTYVTNEMVDSYFLESGGSLLSFINTE